MTRLISAPISAVSLMSEEQVLGLEFLSSLGHMINFVYDLELGAPLLDTFEHLRRLAFNSIKHLRDCPGLAVGRGLDEYLCDPVGVRHFFLVVSALPWTLEMHAHPVADQLLTTAGAGDAATRITALALFPWHCGLQSSSLISGEGGEVLSSSAPLRPSPL